VKRELTVAASAISATAMLVWSLSACSSDGSSAGGGVSSSVGTTSASAAPRTASAAASTTPTIAATSTSPSQSGGPASAKITVDGADVSINGPVTCRQEYTGFVIQAGSDLGSAWVELSTEENPPEASKVRITDAGGAEYYFQAYGTEFGKGDVTVTQSGTSYTITGNIPFNGSGPSVPSKAPDMPRGTLTPFEIEATCP
jgi:Mycobacterium 19 kDa lipoprotein antigen